MKKDESHAQALRERLKVLLSTYQKELKAVQFKRKLETL